MLRGVLVCALLIDLPWQPLRAAQVASVSPQGEVAEVRQISVRFAAAATAAGDPRRTAPFLVECNGAAPAGDARWLDDRAWVYDLREPLAAGARCTLRANPGFKAIDGSGIEGPAIYAFSTGAPIVMRIQPGAGSQIEEEQNFLLQLNGAVTPASVLASVWCESESLGERIPVRIVDGAPRDELLRARRITTHLDRLLLLACQRPLAPDTRARLVWGAGVAAAGQPGLVTRRVQRFEWKVRPRFMADFSCERENAQAGCLPLRPLTLRFNAPVPRALALAVRLQPAQGAPIAPVAAPDGRDDRAPMLEQVRFAAPLPESAHFKLVLPAGLLDESGRALANASSFPLAVATGAMPPLAKFAGAPFGIVEAGPEAMMPLTLRLVQADLADAATGGRVSIKRIAPAASDAELLRWIARLRADHDDETKTRAQPLLAPEADVRRAALPQLGSAAGAAAAASAPAAVRATEVVGVPLPRRGYQVIEVESRILGRSLLARNAPMYARTGVLVTHLGVHFKRGRSSGLVWVTTLDRARPVAGARVAVNDCRGRVLWNGTTDASGIARIARGFDGELESGASCLSPDGLFVTARSGTPGGEDEDLSFVFGGWNRGIEPWRFNVPVGSANEDGAPARIAHTVFDRTLLRRGETVSMKHFLRDAGEHGLSLPSTDTLPTEVVLTHRGSDTEIRLPLAWPQGPRSAESRWTIPAQAALGSYDVALARGERRWGSGSFRVEDFRVPLVDARLAGPAGVQVAPKAITYQAQIDAMAGGPMAAAPLKLSALLRRAAVRFADYDEFSFDAPGHRGDSGAGDSGDESDGNDGSRLVADKIAAVTDKQGAARITVAALPALGGPSDLQAELTFNDPNGEVQTVTQTQRLWPAAVVAGLRVPGWAAARGSVDLTALVLDTAGKPLAGHAVEVVARWRQTVTTRKRIVGGFYAYDNSQRTRDLGRVCGGDTDAQGRYACSAKLDESGEVELIVRARDDAGRVSEAARTVWISGRDEWWFEQANDDRIDVLPEKPELQPGETARLQVRMPFRRATALVTVEREGVVDARVMTLTGREPVIELPVPKDRDASWAPNVVVSVLVLRGRLREAPWWSIFTWGWREPGEWWQAFRYEGRDWRAPTALVDLAKPAFKIGVAQLRIGLAEQRLDVAVHTERSQYKVRETVQATVRVSQFGKPVAGAEIAFAAVDEGLLALQPNESWDLLGALMAPRPWSVETATAQNEIVGRRHYGRKALPPGGGGGRNPTRELFDTLLLWRGRVTLDAQGQARIAVPLNDTLTRFRLVAIADAVADAGANRYGSGSTSITVGQDLQLLSGLAPLVREGDRIHAAFTLRNTTTRSMTVRATLAGSADGEPLAALAPQTVTLAAGAALELHWPVVVPAGVGRIDWTGSADESPNGGGTASPARDRIRIAQAVRSAVPVRVWQSTLRPLEGRLELPIAPPADARPGVGGVQVALRSHLGGALPGLQRYFRNYPYSCLEQKTSIAIGLHDQAAWAKLGDEVAGYLDSDGLANYFPPAAGSAPHGSDSLTAYLVAVASTSGMAWPTPAREAMLGGLTAFIEGRIERRYGGFAAPRADLDARKIAALEALSRYDRVQPRMLTSIAWVPGSWPTSTLLDAWSLYRHAPNLPDAAARSDELQRLLRSRLVAGGATLKFTTEADDDWWWLMQGPDANAARLLLIAADAPAWKGELPRIVEGALARQQRGAWATTTANLWGVLALERFAARFEAVPVTGTTALQWGAQTRSQDWQAAPDGTTVTLPWPATPAPLTATQQGTGRPWLAVQTLAAVPLRAPLFAGYRIARSVAAVERKVPGVWSRGDIVRVHLEIEAQTDMSWVVVDDPVPAGATLLGSGLGRDSAIATRGEKSEGWAWPSHVERGFDAWRGYYEWLPRGRHVVEYTLRLNASGRFGLPPTRVEALYEPGTYGELPNADLEVRP
ncbi:MAG: alpha-2-macroglobulin [Burkholderiales bacterium]|nr:alpha-2-macroglobulin [Burkholderiales bacterium]